jgi:hypothetical protein
VEKRFRALRVVATIFKIFAWIDLVLTILGALGVIVTGVLSGARSGGALSQVPFASVVSGALGGILAGIVLLLAGLVYFLILYAMSESVYVILSIEENTRLTAMAVSGRASA